MRYFTLGMILIFSGILLETGYPSITGSFIGSRPGGMGFGLVITLIGVPFILMSVRMPVIEPSTQESNLYEKEYVIIRSDPRRVENAAHLVKDFMGDVTYTNASNPERLYGIVKTYIPKSKVAELSRYPDKLGYVWDIVVKPSDKEPYTIKESKATDLNSMEGLLYSNDRIMPSSPSGHILIIPDEHNSKMLDVYRRAKEWTKNSSSTLDFIERLNEFVYEILSYKEDFVESHKIVRLDDALKYGGVCKEKAALLQVLLQKFGKKSSFKRGQFVKLNGYSHRHAWVEIEYGGKKWIADPTNGIFSSEDQISKSRFRFKPTENIVERSFD